MEKTSRTTINLLWIFFFLGVTKIQCINADSTSAGTPAFTESTQVDLSTTESSKDTDGINNESTGSNTITNTLSIASMSTGSTDAEHSTGAETSTSSKSLATDESTLSAKETETTTKANISSVGTETTTKASISSIGTETTTKASISSVGTETTTKADPSTSDKSPIPSVATRSEETTSGYTQTFVITTSTSGAKHAGSKDTTLVATTKGSPFQGASTDSASSEDSSDSTNSTTLPLGSVAVGDEKSEQFIDETIKDKRSVWEAHYGFFLSIIIIIAVCFVVSVGCFVCLKCSGRPRSDKEPITRMEEGKTGPLEASNPISDEDIVRDEVPMQEVQNPAVTPNGGGQHISKAEEDNGWVVPLDELSNAEKEKPEVENTKL